MSSSLSSFDTFSPATLLRGRFPAPLSALPSLPPRRERPRGPRNVSRSAEGGLGGGIGEDILTYLSATVLIIPIFKRFNTSPVLGYLLAGFLLSVFGVLNDQESIEKISEIGVLFLLFEQGLELNTERLQALAKYAFGIGLPQVVLTTLAFTAIGISGLGTEVLELAFHAPDPLVSIRSVDEALVIGAALALSSSAFVLQLLQERGELDTKHGAGALGVLLMQDIAVVPLLVLLPLIESAGGLGTDIGSSGLVELVPSALQACLGLGGLVLASRFGLRPLFDVVAESKSQEAFISLCLLTVAGTSFITAELGFSDTLGAFLAGVLLAESNYRVQVEADIKPFRGILLGLFFLSTGASIDLSVLAAYWPVAIALMLGLLGVKSAILTPLARIGGGLSWPESVRVGILLSQGGEFAFVLLALANSLGVLPLQLNKLLIIVVVGSMALTPVLADLAGFSAEQVEKLLDGTLFPDKGLPAGSTRTTIANTTESQTLTHQTDMLATIDIDVEALSAPAKGDLSLAELTAVSSRPVLILGMGPVGMVTGAMLSSSISEFVKLGRGNDAIMGASSSNAGGASTRGVPFVGMDHNPRRVAVARELGYR